MTEKQPTKTEPEMAPDPEEDDLDDLDDVLDQFQQTSVSSKSKDSKPAVPEKSPFAPGAGPNVAPPGLEGDFAAQLQSGMQDLMGEFGGNPDMQREFEKMMAELVAVGEAGTDEEALKHLAKAADATPSTPPAVEQSSKAAGKKSQSGEDSFQDTIRRTMERMQASGDQATTAAQAGGNGSSEEEMLAQLMKELTSGRVGGAGGEGGEEDFNKLLLSMMTQLTNKDILYEPMKELHEKFPGWMEANESKVSKEDFARYKEQHRYVNEIVARFDRQGYADENEADREYIVERMQKMQAAGSPPPDLVGDMSAAQEVLGDLDAGCPTQ
ncbi:Pex19-domain-containing protein [Polychaeton citri CBS 116435]|uniref:Pex19-domain-containing protein n=1 Tax=Polychaeton citri CBS 116435 TaxID=1314669 RepID=A0A9P4QD29_9PEZI|nr:Pex19-domain-containing protein [Polychaeton citri CBS 116435]